jgi:hypothetical protein
MVSVVVVMVHLLLLVILRTNGVNGESNLAISGAVPRQLSDISRRR